LTEVRLDGRITHIPTGGLVYSCQRHGANWRVLPDAALLDALDVLDWDFTEPAMAKRLSKERRRIINEWLDSRREPTGNRLQDAARGRD
jgi:hypothetical protein